MKKIYTQLVAGARRLRPYLRLRPFEDVTTAEGRGRERQRRILLSSSASLLARLITIATALITIPLTLHYLGPERFGLWMTISSIITMLSFTDLGVGNGVLNAISAANGRDDLVSIRQFISSAFVILSAIGAVILLVFVLIYPFVDWPRFFAVKSALGIAEAGAAIAVFICCFALNMPASVVMRAQTALQLGFRANLWHVAGTMSSLVALLIAIHLELGLPYLVAAMAGAPVATAAVNGLIFFKVSEPRYSPGVSFVSRAAIRTVLGTGLLFLVLQVAVAIAYASDNVVIARFLGAEAVTQYAVPDKLFGLIPLVVGTLLGPLWPAYGEAIARGDGRWVKRTFLRSMLVVATCAASAALFLGLFADEILAKWVGPAVQPTVLLLMGMGLWRVTEACGNVLAMLLNGAHIVRIQVWIAVALVTVAISLKIILVQQIGIAGVVWATIIAFLLCVALPYSFLMPRILKRIGELKAV